VRALVVPEGGELPPEEPAPEAEAAPAGEAEPTAEVVAEAPVETAPPGMPETEPADDLVQEVAAGTRGPAADQESA
jgi:hypothetical protein